jgi:hypothetical protein
MLDVIGLLAVLTSLASGDIHRCGLGDLIANGWTPSAPPAVGVKSSRQVAARAAATSLSSLKTDHFVIWWAASGPHAIQGASPGTVASGDSVPALVRAIATGLERARRKYVDTLGYLPPKSAGQGYYWGEIAPTGKYPVEICNIGLATGYSAFGLTYAYTDGSSNMLLASNEANFGSWWDVHDLDGTMQTEDYASDWNTVMQATAAHEEFHSVQFRYEVPTTMHLLYESSAVTMEKKVVPWEMDYLSFAASNYDETSKEYRGLCHLEGLRPLLTARSTDAYSHAWYVKQIMQDLGDDILLKLWQRRLGYPGQTIEATLRTVVAAAGSSFDTTLSRYALRLGLSGRRYAWLSPGFSSFADADSFPTLSGTKKASTRPDTLVLDSGAIQEWIDTTGNASDRIVCWIPDGGANLAHAWKSGTVSGSERLRGSIRQSASSSRQDVWAFSNPGPLAALRQFASSGISTSYLWTASAPARDSAKKGLDLTWNDSVTGAVLTGTPARDTLCTPLLHTDIWKPSSAEDPFAASVVGQSGHALVLEDADRALSLTGAKLTIPYAPGSVWAGRGDGVWTQVPVTSSGSSAVVSWDSLDLSIPLRILTSAGSAPKSLVIKPYPNPYWNGDPKCRTDASTCQGGGVIHFRISGASDGASVEILAADGASVRRLEAGSGQTEIAWDVRNASGSFVKSGVYWYIWRDATGARRGELVISR